MTGWTMALFEKFGEYLADGSERFSIQSCSEWAEKYIHLPHPVTKIPGPLVFDWHPHSRAMHDSECDMNIGMKCAQAAYSNTVLHRSLFLMDMRNQSVLYVLPNKIPDAKDFSTGRFDMILNGSPHLDAIFDDVRNDGMKRAGSRTLWVRGANSKSGLKNIDPNFIVLDEYDEMEEKKIELALRRSDGQFTASCWCLSTPTIPETGIHSLFLESTQNHWRFRCPKCSRMTEMIFPDCLVVCGDSIYDPAILKSHVICWSCKKEIKQEEKREAMIKTGLWEPENPGSTAEGWYVNQLSSCVRKPSQIARDAIKARYSQSAEQELYNSTAGLPHAVQGATITDEMIMQCTVARRMEDPFPKFRIRTMGVDVGNVFHWAVLGWRFTTVGQDLNMAAEAEIIKVGYAQTLNEISTLMRTLQVAMTIFDSEPDVNSTVYGFCNDHRPHALRCKYAVGQAGKFMTLKDEDELKVNVHRTHWLDLVFGRFASKRIKVPSNVPTEFKKHLKNLTKVFKEDPDGDISKDRSDYKRKQGAADHWAHALNYAEIAFPIAASRASNKNIRSVL